MYVVCDGRGRALSYGDTSSGSAAEVDLPKGEASVRLALRADGHELLDRLAALPLVRVFARGGGGRAAQCGVSEARHSLRCCTSQGFLGLFRRLTPAQG